MTIKNYTSGVPASTTIANIENYLAACGVTGIAKQYLEKRVVALVFQAPDVGGSRTIKLPAEVTPILEYLWEDYMASVTRPRKTKQDFLEQAERTAWKLMGDWVRVQMSLIVLQKKSATEVFLAYVWDGKQTFFENLKGSGFKALPAPMI